MSDVLPFVLGVAAKTTLLLAAALAATALMRRASAAARHLVWTLALASTLALPALSLLVPAWELRVLPAAPAAPAATPAPAVSAAEPRMPAAEPTPAPARPSAFAPTAAPDAAANVALDPSRVVLTLWLAGAALLVGRLLAGLLRLWWLGRGAVMVIDGGWLHTAHLLARRLGMDRGVTLLRGIGASVPMTWGVLRPVVWLPAEAEEWDEERRTVVLAHELAHVRRGDAVTQWIAHLALALNWYNPLAWTAVRKFREERERACDDAVLALGTQPSVYADHLLDMVRSVGRDGGPAPAMAMARRSQFEGRLLAILDAAASRRGVSRTLGAGTVALAALAVLPVAALRAAAMDGTPAAPAGVQRWVAERDPASVPAPELAQAERARAAPDSIVGPAPAVAPTAVRLAAAARDSTARAIIEAAAELSSDGDRAVVLRSVLGLPNVDAGDYAALFGVVADMASDGDKRLVLAAVRPAPLRDPAVAGGFLDAAATIGSDGDLAAVLRGALPVLPLAKPEVRRTFLRTVDSLASDGDRSVVLAAVLSQERLDRDLLVGVIRSTGAMESDGDRARVLRLAAAHPLDGTARSAYLEAARGIESDGDRRVVLTALTEGGEKGAPSTRSITRGDEPVVPWSSDLVLDGSHDGRKEYALRMSARRALVTEYERRFVGLEPGGSLNIEHTAYEGGGTPRTIFRSLRVRRSGDELVRAYEVDGRTRAWDGEADAWLDSLLHHFTATKKRSSR